MSKYSYDEIRNMKEVWYACYGSNLSEERFKCYIEGGVCKENGVKYDGCTNTNLWTDSTFNWYRGIIYFGNDSPSWWHTGVAFYDPNGIGTVLMRLYKITGEQLLDVQKQEGTRADWYGNLVDLGEFFGLPVFTMTAYDFPPRKPPCDAYRNLIIRALNEECGISESDARKYLETGSLNVGI